MFTVFLHVITFLLGCNFGLIIGAFCNIRIKKQIDQMKQKEKDDE